LTRTVVIQFGEKLPETVLANTFKGLDVNTVWYKAVIQRIDFWRTERMAALSAFQGQNNAVGVWGAAGGIDFANTLLADLEQLRK
jgi:hypothetical protein